MLVCVQGLSSQSTTSSFYSLYSVWQRIPVFKFNSLSAYSISCDIWSSRKLQTSACLCSRMLSSILTCSCWSFPSNFTKGRITVELLLDLNLIQPPTSSVVVISQPYSQANYFLMCDHQSLTEPSSAGLLNLLVVMAVKVFQIVNHLNSVKTHKSL